jgi:cobalt/nickel transport system permease protein
MAAAPTSAPARRPGRGWDRRRVGLFMLAGLVVMLGLAVLVSPYASSDPDGLEKVAADKGIDRDVDEHDLADSPLADYGVEGVDDARVGTGLAGLIGVLVTFAIGGGLFLILRQRRAGLPPPPPSG